MARRPLFPPGWTLTELLITVAIIAIILAIVVSVLSKTIRVVRALGT